MNIRKIKMLIGIITLLMFSHCTEIIDYKGDLSRDNQPPGVLKSVEVENVSGGAILTYVLPDDDDLMAVKAVYRLDGEKNPHEVYASAYTDTLKLEGFPKEKEYSVDLFVIDKSQNESEPYAVKINPLTPPIDIIRQSLELSGTFGGVAARWENDNGEEIGVSLYYKDSTDNYVKDYTYYTKEKEGFYAFRGFDNESIDFRVVISDKWENISDPLDVTLTPLFEEQIRGMSESGAAIWKRYGYANGDAKWRGDYPRPHKGNDAFEKMFDGIYSYQKPANIFNSDPPGNMLGHYTDNPADNEMSMVPMYLTFDLGVSVKLSRHKIWHRGGKVLEGNAPRYYELWATNEMPKGGPSDFNTIEESWAYWTGWPELNGTDQWKNDWKLIAVCETIPISGATNILDVTEEDRDYARENGFEFQIDPKYTSESFRYVRFLFHEVWAGGSLIHINEVEFWGAY